MIPPVERDDDILGTPVELLTREMFTHILRKLSAYLSRSNFTIAEVAALHIVGRERGISVQALAARLEVSVSAASRIVTGLVARRLVLRRADPSDKRARVITCSKAGERLLDQMSVERVAAIFEVASTLPPAMSAQMFDVVSRFKKEE
jgi:DNA-binding MarR family transcriptional regulator